MADAVEAYDKAKWHYDAPNFAPDLDPAQGFVHTGMFLAWLVNRQLVDEDELADVATAVAAVRTRDLTGPKLYEQLDGVLASSMLSVEGNAFTRAYFDFDRGGYLNDYEATVGAGLPSLYHVTDSWQNYDRIASVIDRRYADWSAAGRPPAWKPEPAKRSPLRALGRSVAGRLRGRP